jgi:hypothetical protein
MPMDVSHYPANWTEISNRIRFERANGQCECTGECGLHEGRCDARHGEPHPVTSSKVILTTAHLGTDTGDKHDKMDVRDTNLKAMCQRCHLIFDLDDHIAHAKETRTNTYLSALREAGQMEMDL